MFLAPELAPQEGNPTQIYSIEWTRQECVRRVTQSGVESGIDGCAHAPDLEGTSQLYRRTKIIWMRKFSPYCVFAQELE
jgi:hypothetical protein